MRTILVLTLLGLTACDWDAVAFTARARFERTAPLDPTGVLHLENVNGKVRVEPWDRAEVRIEAEKSASNETYLEDMKIEIQGEGDRVDVKTRLPRGGLFWGGAGQVEYLIHVPSRARVEVRTVNGAVETDGLSGVLEASTVNGSVRITESAGPVKASTVNGSIRAEYRRSPEDGEHRFSTTNGSVTVYLPEDATGEVDANTVNGGVNTDFPLRTSGRIGNKRLEGRLGAGRASFRIRTVNGSVKVLKAAAGKEV
jgi:hypothetical protein